MNTKTPLIIIAQLCISMTAHAAIVTWVGTAELTTLESNLVGIADQGDAVEIEVTYESSATPSYSTFIAGGNLSEYGAGANVHIRFTIGETVWEGEQSLIQGARTASVHDNANGVVDNISFILQDGWSSVASNSTITGAGANRLRLYFSSTALGNLISGTSLPEADQVNLDGLAQFFGYIDDDDVHSRFTGDITTVAVPEPASAIYIGMAVAIYTFSRRSKYSQRQKP